MTNKLTVEQVELLPCRVCGSPCRVEVFEPSERLLEEVKIWICSKHPWFSGDCSDNMAYLTEDAWNARHRQQAEARTEGLVAAALALAISAGKLNVALDGLEKFRRHREAVIRDMTVFADALTAYRSARP